MIEKENKILEELNTQCEKCRNKTSCLKDMCYIYKIKQIIKPELKVYKVEVKEELRQVVKVSATSEDEAIEMVEKMYEDGDIVLDNGDCIDYSIEIDFRE